MCAMASSFFVLAVKIFFCLVIFSLGLQIAGFQFEACWLFVSVTLLLLLTVSFLIQCAKKLNKQN